MKSKTICNGISTAYEWHSGISSPLYSLASTRTIHDETHRRNLVSEINVCAELAQNEHDIEGAGELVLLKEIVKKAPVNVELVSSEAYDRFSR